MIPARNIVQVNPGVIDGGGNPLSLNGVLLTQNANLPGGAPFPFVSAEAVAVALGGDADEVALAQVYFAGYDNSPVKPGTLWLMRYADAALDATIFGGSLSGVTVAALQALSGTLTINGQTSEPIDLSGITTFSDAATAIADAFAENFGAITCVWNSVLSRFEIAIPGETSITYASGDIADPLALTAATGAILQPPLDADDAASVMDRLYAATQNWLSFTTTWEPDTQGKTDFAEWVNAKNQRFVYVPWDTDAQAIVNGSTSCFGYVAKQAEYNAVMCVYNTVELAMFVLGAAASIDFTRANARITFAFKHQAGLADTVTDEQNAANLLANGYSFYGVYATSNDDFSFLYNGQISGQWAWLDTYVNQVYLNSQFQLALLGLLAQITSIPYNQEGYNLIRASMQDPINQFINFGGIRAGITLSESQRAQVNTAAGLDVASLIETQGYYLQILDPGAQVRADRGTPVINFWYTDGGAVQKITVASIDVM